MVDLSRTPQIARVAAMSALGRDPGPMEAAASLSHHVYVGSDIVVKLIGEARHPRLNREVALAPHLPEGLTAPLLASGLDEVNGHKIRYACYARMAGTALAMGLPGVEAATARSLAEQAVQRLEVLHRWAPSPPARKVLAEPLDHGGLVTKAALLALIDSLATIDRNSVVRPALLKGLTAIADNAPVSASTDTPVHADCHWGNWLASAGRVTALLDFEWARLGEPLDDWCFLIAFSGVHREAVLDVVARETATAPEILRAGCEIRSAAYLASDLHLALTRPDNVPAEMLTDRLSELEQIIVERSWWKTR
ncbi:phosphotransferase family enzyme [Couchioplanes caeruleus]|uniref:Phosphotransferase family enzyme n=1 Tax=Couchioplanes caeruleus TaxID=56438 RepID=A0A3N1GDH4_9ACTN|nr:phosphotransferase family enzyme [Couchioplanes caeruleus]